MLMPLLVACRIPTLVMGSHLEAKPAHRPIDLASLERKGSESRYLSHSHIIYGPELVHVGDYVRLSPTADLDPAVVAERTPVDQSARLLPLTLVMRITALYRGGQGSPLVARGYVFEQKHVPGPHDAALEPTRDESLQNLPASVVNTLPLPFPSHKWRLLAPAAGADVDATLETDVLFGQAVAGRYYPLGLAAMDPPPTRDETIKVVNAWLEEATNGLGVWQDGHGAKGGKGEEGIKALTLLLSGVAAGDRAPRILVRRPPTSRSVSHLLLGVLTWILALAGDQLPRGQQARAVHRRRGASSRASLSPSLSPRFPLCRAKADVVVANRVVLARSVSPHSPLPTRLLVRATSRSSTRPPQQQLLRPRLRRRRRPSPSPRLRLPLRPHLQLHVQPRPRPRASHLRSGASPRLPRRRRSSRARVGRRARWRS